MYDINNRIVIGHLPVSRKGFTIICLNENYPSHDSGVETTFQCDNIKNFLQNNKILLFYFINIINRFFYINILQI